MADAALPASKRRWPTCKLFFQGVRTRNPISRVCPLRVSFLLIQPPKKKDMNLKKKSWKWGCFFNSLNRPWMAPPGSILAKEASNKCGSIRPLKWVWNSSLTQVAQLSAASKKRWFSPASQSCRIHSKTSLPFSAVQRRGNRRAPGRDNGRCGQDR